VKRASIKDIARLAGVAHSTVSRALRSSPLVNAETARRIRLLAEQSGYRPSAAARSLVTRRSATVGVVVTNIADPFAAEAVLGIEDAATGHDYAVILANSNGEAERELKVARAFEERRVDGIIVTSSRVGAIYAEQLSAARVPIVLLNNQHPSEFMHSVMIGNAGASLAATRHLIALGHRRIAYIGDRNGCQSDAERFGGYRAALDDAGLAFRPEYVIHGDGRPEGGTAAMCALLDLVPAPTAVFCYNDMTALGALRAAADRGVGVPASLSVAGFDDLFFARYCAPPLTTVRQPMREMGRLAFEILLKLAGGDSAPPSVKVPGQLIVRQSTAPPREDA
jgi:DNA-binding LacI/PurR family transcriptional regulator